MLFAPAAYAQEPAVTPRPSPVRYRLEVSVDGPDLLGTAHIEIDPVGAARLDTVAIFLFPNLLTERLSGEDTKSFFTIQRRRFREGGMELTSLTTAPEGEGPRGEELPWTGLQLTRPDGRGGEILLPQGTAILATLPAPADGTVKLEAKFKVHVPERFGTFSWYREELFLSGGWYPMVAPRDDAGLWNLAGTLPRVDTEVTLDVGAKSWVVLDRAVHEPVPGSGGRRTLTARVESRPTVFLMVSDGLSGEADPDATVMVLQPREKRVYAKRETRIAHQARDFLVERSLVDPAAPPITVLESPLTRELVFHDAPVALLSSRAYRVFPPMKKYHDVHAARALIAAAVRDRVYSLEPGDDAGWVLDAVAWYLARDWQNLKYEGLRDVRDYARPLSFLPAVDLVLNTPDFPFAAEYYDNWYFTDLLRDDVTRFNHLRPNGRVAYEKLVDRVGPETATKVMESYLQATPADGGFRAVAERETKLDLDSFFEQWRAPLPRVNYRLQNVRVEQTPGGDWMSVLTLVRQGEPVEEPVRIRAKAEGGYGRGVWESAEGGTVYLFTKNKPRAVELDWRGRLLESTRRDNRVPPVWRMLLQYAYVDYEFKLNTAEAGFAVNFERSNDLRNQVDVIGFRRQQSTGAAIGFVHSVGRFTYYRGLLHRFGGYVLVEDLAKNFGKDGLQVVPGFDPTVSEVDSTAGATFSYRFDNRDDWRFGRKGTRIYASVESGFGVVGPASRYYLVQAEIINLQRLSDNNVFAWQAKAGTFLLTDPSDVPLSKLFFLGGIEDVRGISAPEIVGPTKFLFAAEWRHYLLHDVDWNLYFERMRGLQGAFFVDTGYISPRTGAMPPVNDWVTDVGYGLRQSYDFLGVRPMIFRLDVAQRVDDFRTARDDLDLRVYIGAGQSF